MPLPTFAQKLAAKPAATIKNLRFIGAYLNFVNKGDTAAAAKLEQALGAFATPEDLRKFETELVKIPALQEMFDNWYIPPTYTLDDLKSYEPGTLGYAYYRHMTDNGLGIDYYPVPEPGNKLDYFRMRSVQVHDLWHVLAGLAPVPLGEMGILYYTMGHYAAHLEKLAPDMLRLISFITSGSIFYYSSKLSHELPQAYAIQGPSWQSGFNTKPLFAGQWESWWGRSLAEIRAEYGIAPVTPVYDIPAAELLSDRTAVTAAAV
jgi:ubiquinone biosynthesis protein COQ4